MAMIPPNYTPLANTERRAVRGARRTGAANPQETLSASIRIRRRPGAPPLPNSQQLGPSAQTIGHALTREEFAKTYGADPADIETISHFARTHDMKVVESSIPRRTVVLSGKVSQFTKAFATDLGQYDSPNGSYRGREGTLHIPTELNGIVEGIFGLDNRRMATAAAVLGPNASTTPLTPPQVAKLYNFPTTSAAGQTIGILEFGGGYIQSDLQAYFKGQNLPTPAVTAIGIDGVNNSPGSASHPNGDDTEVALDISVAGSVATGAKIAVYFAPWTEQGWVDAVTTAVHDATNHPSVLSISWGWPENESYGGLAWTQAAIDAVSTTFQEAAMLGVTVFAATGDYGSNCGIGDGVAHVLYPGSDPWLTACGGTSIANVSGTTFTEDTWPSTGGGISNIFPLPYWQNWAGVPHSANPAANSGRGIPDIAGNADPSSGYELILYGSANGPWGGTSAVAPLYAALVALLNADMGEPVGYLNYNLYAFAGSNVYRDTNDGVSNASNGAPGYKSGPGWDACTGFGSVNGTALWYALEGVGLPVALADFNNALHAVWKGEERDDRIFTSSFNGTAWTPQMQIPGVATSSGVALAVLGNTLYAAWKGMEADQGIYFSSSTNGTTWAPQQNVPGVGTSTGPRLAVNNGKLYMAWKGLEGDQRLFYSVLNGASWAAQQLIPGTATSVGPALVSFNNTLYAVWKGIYGDPGIYYSSFNGTVWTAQKNIPGVGTSLGPSLAVYNNLVYAIWKGEFNDQRLFYSTFNGTAWTPQQLISGVGSSVGAGLSVFGNKLYAAWKGEAGDQRIWYSSFQNGVWAPQQQIAGVGTSPDQARKAREKVHA
jgi:hypothetical protein